ncbi:hypothetical protein RhiirA5_426315 [Rhizophagus irregularis]|uniref:Uncharacterized protein n=1 Tax=Rhizophagus irregularis TaxID=588596 RepID=A0A2N0P4C7_9GLOM|nr:hypothetical protein RhiirA5_426315 [Rhizophagus irregularis]
MSFLRVFRRGNETPVEKLARKCGKRFNDIPTMPGCRNGIAEQTQNAIVTVFTTNRGIDVKGLNTVFLFRTNDDLGQCENHIPRWSRHQNGIPDVCVSAVVVHKLTLSGQIDVAPFDYAFNQNR